MNVLVLTSSNFDCQLDKYINNLFHQRVELEKLV